MIDIEQSNNCPQCNKILDCHVNPYNLEDMPHNGDLSICVNCFTILIFDENLNFRKLENEEFFDLPEDVKESFNKVKQKIIDIKL